MTARTQLPPITEKDFTRQVIDLARTLGWDTYHPYLSVRSAPGWPDLALIRPPRLIVAELKRQDGKTTTHQDRWLDMLRRCATGAWWAEHRPLHPQPLAGLEVYLWRPSDLDDIARILR